jgi:hypothetical protein
MSGLRRVPGRRVRRSEGQGNRVDPGGPYDGVAGGGRFSIRNANDPQQLPCQQPPWGQLTAVDMKTGRFAWRVTLGVTDSLPPDLRKTGRPGNGGTIVTRGGLVFVGATDDARFRAFEARTGKELWTFMLPAAAQATPITYRGPDGRQYDRHHVDGRHFFGNPVTDDSVMAFALPARSKIQSAARKRGWTGPRPATRKPGGFGVDGPAYWRPTSSSAAPQPRRRAAPSADDPAVAPDGGASVAVPVEPGPCAGQVQSRSFSHGGGIEGGSSAIHGATGPSRQSSGIT